MIYIRVDEETGRAMGMGKLRIIKVWRFSSNELWKNIVCLIFAPIFDLGGSRLWDKEEQQKKIVNKSKRRSIRAKVDFYGVCEYSIF